MQYLIDGKIVAGCYCHPNILNIRVSVGVVDLLPQCLSSAYFYYDPDYAFLNLGSFSALKEIEFVREIVKERPELHYYYVSSLNACRKNTLSHSTTKKATFGEAFVVVELSERTPRDILF